MTKNTNIRTSEDPTIRFAKLFAKLYYFMSKQMIESLGEEEGKKAILKSINEFGMSRIESMKEEAVERGLPTSGRETYDLVRDMPGVGWEFEGANVKKCPFHDMWKSYGKLGMELGNIYCEIDHVLFNEFGMDLERNYCLTTDDDLCEFKVSQLNKE